MADEPPILPGLDLIGEGKDALIAARPSTRPWVERGVYSHLFVGLRAQYLVARQGLAAEAQAARLSIAAGDALTELASSNFDTDRNGSATTAIGELVLARSVVHVRPADATLALADATDGTTSGALLTEIASVLNPHLQSVYNQTTGLGSHALADSSGTFLVAGTTNMGDLVSTANDFYTRLGRHFENEAVSSGSALAIHVDADSSRLASVPVAFASASGSAFSANSVAAQTSLLRRVNAMRRAVLAHLALEARAGTVKAGTRVSVVGDPAASPAVEPADYVTQNDFYVPPGLAEATIRIEGRLQGSASNRPEFSPSRSATISLRDALYDSGAALPFSASELRAAGGGPGQSDGALVRAARASWRGSYGPTDDGLLAGSLRALGVEHYVRLDDLTTGRAWIYATDASWAQSDAWLATIGTALRDGEWQGVGQRISFGRVLNRVIRVRLTVVLRESSMLADTEAVSASIRKDLVSYFDDRPDWHAWKAAAIKGVAARADKAKILSVSAATVVDEAGVPIAEPSEPSAGSQVYHWRLQDGAIDATYVAPS